MPTAPNAFTLLEMTGIGVPPYSARGVSQSLAPIEQAAHIVRAINGALLDLSYVPFQKYRSTISCEDQTPPAVDGVWPGKLVTVHCVAELCVVEGGTPARPVAYGSTRTEAGWTFYRPVLEMMVLAFNTETDEYGAAIGWSMDLEEA